MKVIKILACSAVLLLMASNLMAGEAILYAGFQKPGEISFSREDVSIARDMLEGGYGGTFGLRFSSGKPICWEENISFSPRFARSGVHAFQMDTNLVLQAPGKIAPYATAGLGMIVTWGQDIPESTNPTEWANFAFSLGKSLALNYGAGIKVRRAFGPVGINFDVRQYIVPDARDGSLKFLQMGIGAVFNW